MTTTERPEKRAVLVRCEHPSTEVCACRRAAVDEILARWPPVVHQSAAEQPDRDRVVLADIRTPRVRVSPQPPLAITDDDERHGDSIMGAAGAWACVAIVVLLMFAIAVRQLWLWWSP